MQRPGAFRRLESVVSKRAAQMFSLAAMIVVSVTACGSTPNAALTLCGEHFRAVRAARSDTVAGATSGGPRTVPFVAPHLGSYGADTPVTLCLVRRSADSFDAVGITPDGKSYTLWTQDSDKQFDSPS